MFITVVVSKPLCLWSTIDVVQIIDLRTHSFIVQMWRSIDTQFYCADVAQFDTQINRCAECTSWDLVCIYYIDYFILYRRQIILFTTQYKIETKCNTIYKFFTTKDFVCFRFKTGRSPLLHQRLCCFGRITTDCEFKNTASFVYIQHTVN